MINSFPVLRATREMTKVTRIRLDMSKELYSFPSLLNSTAHIIIKLHYRYISFEFSL